MKIIYIANDGKNFETLEECKEYEEKINPKPLYRVEVEIRGWVTVEVNADSDCDAAEKAADVVRAQEDYYACCDVYDASVRKL